MTTLTRQELFDKVWSKPVTKVAAELGVSDTAVRKMCDRHDIPVPGRGYWAQVAAGKTFPKPNLRPAKTASLDSITFVGAPQPSPEVKVAAERLKAQTAQPKPPAEAHGAAEALVVVASGPADDGDIHPLAARTRDKLAAAKADEAAQISGKGLFTVTASADQADRIAEVLTLLLRAMETRGWSAKGDDKGLEPWIARVIVLGLDRIKHLAELCDDLIELCHPDLRGEEGYPGTCRYAQAEAVRSIDDQSAERMEVGFPAREYQSGLGDREISA
jgi:hypothetical protein